MISFHNDILINNYAKIWKRIDFFEQIVYVGSM